jgi:hypothetical protein
MVGMSELRIEKIPPKDFKAFKLRCIIADQTLREALIWCIAQIGKGKIVLPKKEAK